MTQLTLTPGHVQQAHDDLERHYTPQRLADMCVERAAGVWRRTTEARPREAWVEAHAGGAAFVRAMLAQLVAEGRSQGSPMEVDVVTFDLDPTAEAARLADEAKTFDFFAANWLDVVMSGVSLVAGNPPFSEALAHLLHTRRICPNAVIAWILPIHYPALRSWADVLRDHPLHSIHPILPRPWGQHVRETALFVWGPVGWRGTTTYHTPIEWAGPTMETT